MKKYLFVIIVLFLTAAENIYSFSLKEFTAKLDIDKANRLMKKGDYEGAINLYEKALSKKPNSPEIFYNMGTAMSYLGDMENASQLFDTAKKNINKNTSKEMKNSIHYNAGIAKIESKNYQGAVDELVESLVSNPEDNNARKALEYAQKKLEDQKQQNNSGFNNQQNNQSGQSDNNNGNSGQNDNDNQNNDNGNNNQDSNNQNNSQNNNDSQNENNQNNDNGNNNQDSNNENGSNQDNENNDERKSDIDKLLESLRNFRKDKDNGDQYYGGGRIDKDW